MPSQPAWFHRLEEILALLRGFDTRYLDRQAGQEAVERCFDLGHRQWDQLGAVEAAERVRLIGPVQVAQRPRVAVQAMLRTVMVEINLR